MKKMTVEAWENARYVEKLTIRYEQDIMGQEVNAANVRSAANTTQ